MTTPLHIHERFTVAGPAGTVCRWLHAQGRDLAERATATAVRQLAALHEQGRFVRPAAPTVRVRPGDDTELGCLNVTWDSDEEASGWPAMELAVLAAPTNDGATEIVVLSPRHPGYDLSRNRADKQVRDRLAHLAVQEFGRALIADYEESLRS